MLIKLNCCSIKRNIYEDAASTADLPVFCKRTDFLMSPPSRNLLFSARVLHLSLVSVCFVVSFQGTERVSPAPTTPWHPPGSPLMCSDLGTPSPYLTAEFGIFLTAPMTDRVWRTPKSTSLEFVPWFSGPSEPVLGLSWQSC